MTIRPARWQTLLIAATAALFVSLGWWVHRDAPVLAAAAAVIGLVGAAGAVRRSRQRLSVDGDAVRIRGGLLGQTIRLRDITEVKRGVDGSLVILATGGRRIRFPGDAPKLAEFSDILIKRAGLTDLRSG